MLKIFRGGAFFHQTMREKLGVELKEHIFIDNELEDNNLNNVYKEYDQSGTHDVTECFVNVCIFRDFVRFFQNRIAVLG